MNELEVSLLKDLVRRVHESALESINAIFKEVPPDDDGVYVYTYYDAGLRPIYHGYTSNARKRARKHYNKAPWAGWVDEVRYRRCSSPTQAYALEHKLQRMVPSLCHNRVTRTYYGEDWAPADGGTDHLKGTCLLPGGICDWERYAPDEASLQCNSRCTPRPRTIGLGVLMGACWQLHGDGRKPHFYLCALLLISILALTAGLCKERRDAAYKVLKLILYAIRWSGHADR
jgi:hypothetical protein